MPIKKHISMTRQARIRLKKELVTLRGRPGIEVPDDYMDTGENRDDYRARRSRIGAIESLLTDAIVVDDSADDRIAAPDMAITVYYDDSGHIDTFVLGGYGAGDHDNKIYPLRSPIGRAVAGARPGEHRTCTLPGTAPIAVTVLKVEPASRGRLNKHPTSASPAQRAPHSKAGPYNGDRAA